MTTRVRRVPALLLLLVLTLAGCGDGGDPTSRLAEAFEETFDGSFAYALTVEADADSLRELGDGAGQAAEFLAGFGVSGVVTGESTTVEIELLGRPLLQVRSVGEQGLYLQLGLNDLLSAFGGGAFDPQDEIVPALDALGLGEDVKSAVIDLFSGAWVGIEGDFASVEQGLEDLFGTEGETVDEEAARQEFRQLLGGDATGFLERYVEVVEEVEDEELRRYVVRLRLRELVSSVTELNDELGAGAAPLDQFEGGFADVPESVPGTVVTVDGLVESIRFELPDADAEGRDAPGVVELRLELDDHGAVPPVEAPAGATIITAEQANEVLKKLFSLTGQLGGAGLGDG